jgi:hypothetical protein
VQKHVLQERIWRVNVIVTTNNNNMKTIIQTPQIVNIGKPQCPHRRPLAKMSNSGLVTPWPSPSHQLLPAVVRVEFLIIIILALFRGGGSTRTRVSHCKPSKSAQLHQLFSKFMPAILYIHTCTQCAYCTVRMYYTAAIGPDRGSAAIHSFFRPCFCFFLSPSRAVLSPCGQ